MTVVSAQALEPRAEPSISDIAMAACSIRRVLNPVNNYDDVMTVLGGQRQRQLCHADKPPSAPTLFAQAARNCRRRTSDDTR